MPASSSTLHPLRTALGPTIARQRRFHSELIVTLGWLALLAVSWVGIRGGWWRETPALVVLALLLAAAIYALARWYRQVGQPDLLPLARRIEKKNPHLNGRLITAVEQEPDGQTGQFNFLQRYLLAQTLEDDRRQPWVAPFAPWQQGALVAVQWVTLFTLLGLLGSSPRHSVAARSTPVAALQDAVEVTPGDVSLERGSSLIVTAKFGAPLPGEATLLLEGAGSQPQRIALQQSLNDPLFGGALPEVKNDLTYHIAYNGQQTRDYTIRVFDFPRLEQADAKLEYPAYTKLPAKTIVDTKRVAAVEGTKIDLDLKLNKPVKTAEFVAKDGSKIPLQVSGEKAIAKLRGYRPQKSQAYELHLTDADGRASKVAANFALDVLPNRRPEIKIIAPKGDQRVSPLQEVTFQTEMWDDFGLPSYGLTYTVAGGETKEVVLGQDAAGDTKTPAAQTVKLEELNLAPDQLISWFAWAEDIGADGQPRRTSTDLYFAEVRPFEEIFRQGQAGEGEQGGAQAGQEAAKLSEIQKQVIAATWKLQRTEAARPADAQPAPSEQYGKDVPVVRDAQKQALTMAQAMREKLEEPTPQGMADLAIREMQRAIGELDSALTNTAPLPRALEAEQSAYNALLKLAAHEFRVSRSKSKQSGQSQSRQEQLDQLEMKEEKDRYETKKEATPQEKQDAQQQLAILSRLKELAQRQHDLNEKVRELQAALPEAKTDTQKEELQKELKRLQEEQQQMLADVDELQQKMQGQEDSSKYAEERKQLEETRGEAQKANEALRQEKPAEALAAGTRTERELQQLRDDFRKKSSAQFNEQMRQMRQEARTLVDRQQELAEKLQQEASSQKPVARPTLDGASPREELVQRIDQQQEKLKGLQDDMKTVSEQAEAAEPLLAKELYDALRKNAQANTDDTLKKTGMLARRGYATQAKQFSDKAGTEMEELKAGVERAAESILGNEEESLRLARAELDALSEEINREIAQAAPQLAQNERAQTGAEQEQNENSPSEKGQGARAGRQSAQEAKDAQGGKGEREYQQGKQPGSDAARSGSKGDAAGQENNKDGQEGAAKQPGDGASKMPPEGGEKQNAQPNSQGQQPARQAGEQPAGKSGEGQDGQQPGKEKSGPGEQGQGEGRPKPGEDRVAQGQQSRDGQEQGQQGQQGQQPGASGQGQSGRGQQRQAQNGKGAQESRAGQQSGQPGKQEQEGQQGQGPAGQSGQGRQAGNASPVSRARADKRVSSRTHRPRRMAARAGVGRGTPSLKRPRATPSPVLICASSPIVVRSSAATFARRRRWRRYAGRRHRRAGRPHPRQPLRAVVRPAAQRGRDGR